MNDQWHKCAEMEKVLRMTTPLWAPFAERQPNVEVVRDMGYWYMTIRTCVAPRGAILNIQYCPLCGQKLEGGGLKG